MPRPTITTSWNRDRYQFFLIDTNQDRLVDVDGGRLLGLTDTNPITTQWV